MPTFSSSVGERDGQLRWVFVLHVPGSEDRVGLGRLFRDLLLPEAAHRPIFVIPPVVGVGFFRAEPAEVEQWLSMRAPQDAVVVHLLEDEPGLRDAIYGREGLFYVGVPHPEDALPYANIPNVTAFRASGPLDYATIVMRDWCGVPNSRGLLFDEGEALRMAALSADFPANLEDPLAHPGPAEGPPGAAADPSDSDQPGAADSDIHDPGGDEVGDPAVPWGETAPHLYREVRTRLSRHVLPGAGIVSDRWVTTDGLGYRIFAEAIADFLRHPETEPPVTIGIRSPWGAGKTTLMRMIQEDLDPGAARNSPTRIRLTGMNHKDAGRTLRVGRTLRMLRSERSEDALRIETEAKRRLTVWFNPWIYQSTEQIWAGLAREIIRQVTDRMPAGQREAFWFALNKTRIDREAVRRGVYRVLVRRVAPVILLWLPLGLVWLVFASMGVQSALVARILGVAGAGVGVWAALRIIRFRYAPLEGSFRRLVEWGDPFRQGADDPAPSAITIADPSYASRAGLLAFIDGDLRNVLELVATPSRPVVVFIDDLDRCSPGTVAQVLEAVNVFLAGQLPNCAFIVALEPQATVASIEVAYRDLLPAFPPSAEGPSLGWRFLDKFVQLPLQLPPSRQPLRRYLASLSASLDPHPAGRQQIAPESRGGPLGPSPEELAEQIRSLLDPQGSIDDIWRVADVLRQKFNAADDDVARAATDVFDSLFAESSREVLDEELHVGGERYLNNPVINPREVKRIVNLFRMYTIIGVRQGLHGSDAFSLREAATLAVMATRWPEVMGLTLPAGQEWMTILSAVQGDGEPDGADVSVFQDLEPSRRAALVHFLRQPEHRLSASAVSLLLSGGAEQFSYE